MAMTVNQRRAVMGYDGDFNIVDPTPGTATNSLWRRHVTGVYPLSPTGPYCVEAGQIVQGQMVAGMISTGGIVAGQLCCDD